MIRFISMLVVVLGTFPVLAEDVAAGAFHRTAFPEVEQDGTGLIGESDRLTSGQRHFLPPLSEAEIDNLFHDEEAKPGVPKIGIVRNLTSPATLSRSGFARAAKVAGGTTSLSGGRLTELEDGRLVWTTSVSSPGADEIRLRFDHVSMPDSARIYVYAQDERYGPYTSDFLSDVTKGVYPFWSHTIQGSVAYVEVQVDDPNAEIDLTLDGVGHFETAAAEATAQPEGTECFKDVACAADEASLVTALSTATARLRYKSGASFYYCTGALVNVSSTSEFEPYLLTANHCIDTQESASSLEALWDYRTSTCGGTPPSTTSLPKVVGSTILATDAISDFSFVRLSSNPAGSEYANGSRYYLGWTASKPQAETTLYRASHPNGNVQKWSRTIARIPSETCSSLPPTRFIYSAGSYGGTTGGSSGASATNAAGQIVGQNYGKCGTDTSDPCNYAVADSVDGAFATTYPYLETWLKPVVETAPCSVDDATLCLQSGRFEVQLSAIDPRTQKSDTGYVMASTDVFGYYAFPVLAENQTDPQVFVKVLDGRPINGRWWVFYASLTDVEFTIHVRDTLTGATKSYSQAPYTQESNNDTNAFTD